MTLIKLHQKKKPFHIVVDSIKQVWRGNKGIGSLLLTDMDIYNVEVDESPETVVDLMAEDVIEVELIANDDEEKPPNAAEH